MNYGNLALAIAPGPQLTILSHGMGQDSSTLLLKYINDPEFRDFYAPHDFMVLFAETGDEHDETYEHLQTTIKLCKDNDIPFYHITPIWVITPPAGRVSTTSTTPRVP